VSQPSTWQQIPVSAGLLRVLISGVVTVVLASYGFLYWLDRRINSAIDSDVKEIRRELDSVNQRADALRYEVRRLRERVLRIEGSKKHEQKR
jgi:hypothetical protein